jgi:hypothetical protein
MLKDTRKDVAKLTAYSLRQMISSSQSLSLWNQEQPHPALAEASVTGASCNTSSQCQWIHRWRRMAPFSLWYGRACAGSGGTQFSTAARQLWPSAPPSNQR